jgi:hypothetical protein
MYKNKIIIADFRYFFPDLYGKMIMMLKVRDSWILVDMLLN